MQSKIYSAIKIILIAAMYLTGYLVLNKLPDMVPSHWNIAGEPDSWMLKNRAVWLFPTITLGLAWLFKYLPKIDPKKAKYAQFKRAWEIFQIVFLLFFAYIYFVTLYASLHSGVNVGKWILMGVGILFVVIGNYMSKIKQNFFVGIKTPWTLSSEDVWNKTHRLGSWCFVICGLLFIIESQWNFFLIPVFVTAIIIMVAVPIIYSYILFALNKKQSKDGPETHEQ